MLQAILESYVAQLQELDKKIQNLTHEIIESQNELLELQKSREEVLTLKRDLMKSLKETNVL